jgi:TonB family protein
MLLKSILKRAVPFTIALLFGILVAGFLTGLIIPGPGAVTVNEPKRPYTPEGSGSSGPGDRGVKPGEKLSPQAPCTGTCNVKILSKPRPNYTEEARQNSVQGDVSLRISFLATGEIGGISPLQTLPAGLTEQAISAARNIRFKPATRDGIPYSKTMVVKYTFTIY